MTALRPDGDGAPPGVDDQDACRLPARIGGRDSVVCLARMRLTEVPRRMGL
ncbi:MAG: hypothetical protein J0H86_06010 [Xanthomonadaceae bacterium]|nr:hypothetical protein [Xanthomonadaceae bacterium]